MACATPARAAPEWLSPGKLSAPHAFLNGSAHCDSCHQSAQASVDAACVGCHRPIADSLRHNTGLHGRLTKQQRACASCHGEHRDAATLIAWPQGDPQRFQHAAATGYALTGAHQQVACAQCHRSGLAIIPDLQAESHFMGLGRACADCHADEHRGQLGRACEGCHATDTFQRARFDHNRSAYPLTGAHQQAACADCHPQTTASSPRGLPPRHAEFTRYRGVAHDRCIRCHDDSHDGAFGSRCMQCHSTEGWQDTHFSRQDTRSKFHERTQFPLRGSHAVVPCKACHPQRGQAMQMRGLRFARCADCHADAHAGQVQQDCAACHRETTFSRTTFDEAQHAEAFPLVGAHRSVACDACHTHAGGADGVARSDARLRLGPSAQRCSGCHASPHGAQFEAYPGCTACHNAEDFAQVDFDHARSQYPLTGKHAEAACSACHARDPATQQAVYRPLSTACNACHSDPHAGQFANQGCDACHSTQAFAPSAFRHGAPGTFALEGAHQALSCDACHRAVDGIPQWAGLPTTCSGCHADWHEGAFTGLAPAGSSDCSTCHTQHAWTGAVFTRHEATQLPLAGAHARALCEDCHAQSLRAALSPACAGCHRDAHHGELGAQCQGCHDTESWRAEFSIEAHRATNFPLRGAHGALACQECHPGANAHGAGGTPATCMGCHAADYASAGSASVNHTASGFSTNCRDCHDPWAFQHARLDSHDTCFPIQQGAHAGLACAACHRTLVGTVANGACRTGTSTCTQCHAHNPTVSAQQHAQVPGYAFDSARCYACHQR